MHALGGQRGNIALVNPDVSQPCRQAERSNQAGDGVSKLSVRYGVTGDAGISNQIIDKTKEELKLFGWF